MTSLQKAGLVIEIAIGILIVYLVKKSTLDEGMKVLVMLGVAILSGLVSFFVPIGSKGATSAGRQANA